MKGMPEGTGRIIFLLRDKAGGGMCGSDQESAEGERPEQKVARGGFYALWP